MRQINVIGIGAGDPEDVTVRAVRALNESEVLFFPSKAADGGDLLRARHEICQRHLDAAHQHRIVEIPDPPREPEPGGHRATVGRWYELRVAAWETAIREHVPDGGCGAFLAWGDPALYDGTLRVLDSIRARGDVAFAVDVVPGISAVQLLTARHRITLNQIGGSVLITTGRELTAGWAGGAEDVVVMLDPHCSFRALDEADVTIYWGAYLGTPDEILVSGPIGERGDEIARIRAEAREAKGWVFDIYLLRRARER